MLKHSLVQEYLEWTGRETERLFESACLPKSRISTAIVEVPVFTDKLNKKRFVASALSGGYVASNLSIFKYEKCLYQTDFLKQLSKSLPIRSVHGSSIKREIKTGIPYRKFLEQDLKLLNSLNLKNSCAVNFDLYAGQPKNFTKQKSFEATRVKNLKALCKTLKINSNSSADYMLIERIVRDVGSVFSDSMFDIFFEMPGSKGWSMFPEISEKYFEYICLVIKKYLPKAKLCIDVGHVITWSRSSKDIDSYLKVLEKYKEMIGMLHISSAGSNNEIFERLYRSVYKKNVPDWHVRGLDLSLAVCEEKQIKLISDIRKLYRNHVLLEVSEIRTPREALNDYFGQFNLDFIDNSSYFKNLSKQGKILGYV